MSRLIVDAPPGVEFDAQQLLATHPELCHDKSAVLDLAYEEFCRRTEAGELVQPAQFAERFSRFRSSVCHQIEAHRWAVCHAYALDAPLDWPTAGEEFLGFRLIEKLGQGAFSRVFLAREIALGERPVVVKLSRLAGLEPHMLGRLRHPHIVPVHSVQQDGRTGLSAICMPFLGRATLQDLLDRMLQDPTPPRCAALLDDVLCASQCDIDTERSLGADVRRARRRSYVSAIVQLGVQMTDALEHAHRRAVYHCDIKPSNVLLTWSGARLLDFNLSLAGDARPGVGGTLPYMAPELLLAVGGKSPPPASAASDLFSLGVVLYQLLSGRLPWDLPSGSVPLDEAAAVMRARQARAPIWPEAAQRQLNPSLVHHVSSCLAFRPSDRPASARTLADLLRRELRLLPSGRRFVQLHRRGAVAAMCGLVAAGAAAAVGIHALPTDEEAGRRAFACQDFASAVRRFDATLQKRPEHHEPRFLRGRAQMSLGRFDLAQEDFALLNERLPRHPCVTLGLGECQARQTNAGRDDVLRAIANFRIAAAAFPANAGLCNNLGYCELQLHHVREAIDWLKKAVELAPTQAVCRLNLALAAIEGAARKTPLMDLSRAYEEVLAAIRDQPRVEKLHRLAADILAARVRQAEVLGTPRQETFAAAAHHLKSAWEWGCTQHDLASVIAAWEGIASRPEVDRLRMIVQRPQLGQPQVLPHLLDAFVGVDLPTRDSFA